MPEKIIYRQQLIQAIGAFLEGTPTTLTQALTIIQQCSAALNAADTQISLNDIIWGSFIKALTDPVFYKNEKFLRDTRETLRGHSTRNIARTVFNNDYHIYFTANEEILYTHLLSMLDFILATPFAKIHEATYPAWQNKATWATTRGTIPEALQADQIDAEYWQRKTLLEEISEKLPFPGDAGDETIYHLVLREVTSILTAIRVGHAAITSGYPVLEGPYTDYRAPMPSLVEGADATESLSWAKKSLDALAGKGDLCISWRLSKAATFDGDLLLISLH